MTKMKNPFEVVAEMNHCSRSSRVAFAVTDSTRMKWPSTHKQQQLRRAAKTQLQQRTIPSKVEASKGRLLLFPDWPEAGPLVASGPAASMSLFVPLKQYPPSMRAWRRSRFRSKSEPQFPDPIELNCPQPPTPTNDAGQFSHPNHPLATVCTLS